MAVADLTQAAVLDRLLDPWEVRAAYQPIVDLSSGAVVGGDVRPPESPVKSCVDWLPARPVEIVRSPGRYDAAVDVGPDADHQAKQLIDVPAPITSPAGTSRPL